MGNTDLLVGVLARLDRVEQEQSNLRAMLTVAPAALEHDWPPSTIHLEETVWITVGEAAGEAHVTERQIRKWIETDNDFAVLVRGRWWVHRDRLMRPRSREKVQVSSSSTDPNNGGGSASD